MPCSAPAVTIAACLVCILILATCWCAPLRHRDTFYTSAATEEPTRPYTPYVGTTPNGPWGVTPWAIHAKE